MGDIAGWIAPIATMLAAMMTAANLGARVTGWGFVVFTCGSIAWTAVGTTSGQTNLIASNGFLTLVNLVGIWRWLGRQRAYEDGGRSAREASLRSSAPTLFTATGITGMPVVLNDGTNLGKAIEALITCRSGEISYVVVATGSVAGLAEELRAVPAQLVTFSCDKLSLAISRYDYDAIELLADGDWPASAQFQTKAPS